MLKKSDIHKVTAQLRHIDFTEREAKTYLQALQTGPSTVQELSRRLGENRVTIHSAVQQLIKRGVLFETRRGRKRLIVAEEPRVFEDIITQKEKSLALQRKSMQQLSNFLNKVSPPDSHTPGVEFYEDVDGFKRMLERTLDARGEFLAIINAGLFSDLVGHNYLLDYFTRRSNKKIYSRLIFPDVDWARTITKRAKEFKVQVRILPDHMWPSGIFSWNNCLSLKSFTHNRITCTILENQDIATFFREVIFEIIWEQAKPVRL